MASCIAELLFPFGSFSSPFFPLSKWKIFKKGDEKEVYVREG